MSKKATTTAAPAKNDITFTNVFNSVSTIVGAYVIGEAAGKYIIAPAITYVIEKLTSKK